MFKLRCMPFRVQLFKLTTSTVDKIFKFVTYFMQKHCTFLWKQDLYVQRIAQLTAPFLLNE